MADTACEEGAWRHGRGCAALGLVQSLPVLGEAEWATGCERPGPRLRWRLSPGRVSSVTAILSCASPQPFAAYFGSCGCASAASDEWRGGAICRPKASKRVAAAPLPPSNRSWPRPSPLPTARVVITKTVGATVVSLMSPEERHATLMLEEMQLAPGLVYKPSSGTVLGAPTIPLADATLPPDSLATHGLKQPYRNDSERCDSDEGSPSLFVSRRHQNLPSPVFTAAFDRAFDRAFNAVFTAGIRYRLMELRALYEQQHLQRATSPVGEQRPQRRRLLSGGTTVSQRASSVLGSFNGSSTTMSSDLRLKRIHLCFDSGVHGLTRMLRKKVL
ncbi:hypothetical protein HPB50_007755 [Hyalomma asiaticum]|uniref:Uncharacterized protein n=1 Tax=Hyalomma asiaticum TaxID=266040 RepID=A0ACB7TEA6_HYAAI|nr:hypothetical protein HPB50_007755 [Hyalomma asiaticum]